MTSRPQCPFCLKEFETIEQVTQHLIFDNCSVQTIKTPADPSESSSDNAENEDASAGIVLQS